MQWVPPLVEVSATAYSVRRLSTTRQGCREYSDAALSLVGRLRRRLSKIIRVASTVLPHNAVMRYRWPRQAEGAKEFCLPPDTETFSGANSLGGVNGEGRRR